MPNPKRRSDKGKLASSDKQRAIPPRHRDRVLVLLVHQMICVIGAKDPMMRQRVPRIRIAENRHMLMHQKAVHGPFEAGAEYATNRYSHRSPEEVLHLFNFLYITIKGAQNAPKRR